MATYSSILARRTPWTEEPGKPDWALWFMRLQRVRHDWATELNGAAKQQCIHSRTWLRLMIWTVVQERVPYLGPKPSRLPDDHISASPCHLSLSFPFHTCSQSYEVTKRKILFMKSGHQAGENLVKIEKQLHCDMKIRNAWLSRTCDVGDSQMPS